MKTVTIRNLVIGEGTSKIIISLMGKDIVTVKSEALAYHEADSDTLERRVDHFTDVSSTEAVLEAVCTIHDVVAGKPLLFTFRSAKEDSEQTLSVEHYIALNHVVVDSGLVNMIDLKLFTGDELVKATVEHTYAKDVLVAMSNHGFHKALAAGEIIRCLCKMQELGADILRTTLMPQNKADVLTLLSAALEMRKRYVDRPMITMSTARTRMASRLSGGIFGSTVTFGAVKKASALGQISVTGLCTILTILHQT